MQDTMTDKPTIDYPREDEQVASAHYTFRISAPMNAEKVEVCVDGAPWQLCRYSGGYWWYDWSGYFSGEHEIVARVLPFDSRSYVLTTRRFTADVSLPAAARTTTQFSVTTSNEPWMLARLTQVLSAEEVAISGMMTLHFGDQAAIQFFAKKDGLKQKLEQAGLPVTEREVFRCELSNEPEELNRLVRSLAERDVTINSLYGTVDGSRVKIVLAVDQPEQASEVIDQLGVRAS